MTTNDTQKTNNSTEATDVTAGDFSRPPCSQILAAAEEIALAIGNLCAAQGGVVDIGAIKRKTAAAIDRHTHHTEMREVYLEMVEALVGIRDNSHDEAATNTAELALSGVSQEDMDSSNTSVSYDAKRH